MPTAPPRPMLTAAQQRAVDHRGGPLIVLAGPGTGKTRVIIHRIASLISEGVEPEKIVAVTFTVKAAEQLRARLAEMLGAAAGGTLLAARVNVHTFHGLGLRILNRFPDLAGLPGAVEMLDGPQGRAILRDLITDLKVLPESAAAGREAILEMAEAFNERLWNLGVDPASVMQRALAWGRELDEQASSLPAGDEEARRAQREARFHQRRAFELARLAIAAEQEFRGRGLCAFGDMISLPIRLLRTHPEAAAVLHGDYRHYVVDEFQDVNAAQIRLLSLLCPPERDPDLCVVGDDDQAIYGFRGSDDRAMHTLAALYPRVKRVVLEENFRSRRCIVDFAGAIMAGATERFSEGKELRAAGPLAGEAGPSVLHVKAESEAGDAPVVAALLQSMRRERPEVQWSRYAVIARSHIDLDRVSAALALARIPAQRRDRAWQDDEGVKDVLAWVEVLVNERALSALTRVLMRPPFSIPLAQVAPWMQAFRGAASRSEVAGKGDTAAGGDEAGAGESAGASEAQPSHPGPAALFVLQQAPSEPALVRFGEVYQRLRALSVSTSADEMVFKIIQSTGVMEADLPEARARAARVSHLVQLLRIARLKQKRLPPPGDLPAFWQYWNDLSSAEEMDPGERVDAGEGASGGDEAGNDEDAGVQLLTAHASKGLEFDTVIVPRVCPPHGYPKLPAEKPELRLPPGTEELAGRGPAPRSAKQRAWAEERRVFYVACTRAERRLAVVGPWRKSRSTSLNFLDELVRDYRGTPLVQSREEREVVSEAARALEPGAGTHVGGGVGHALGPLAMECPAVALGAGEAELQAARRAMVRVEAARALDRIDHAGASAADLDQAASELARAAASLAGLAHVAGGREPPGFILKRAGEGGTARLLELARADAERAREGRGAVGAGAGGRLGALVARPMTPPLELSYTLLDTYRRCPRCAFVRYVLKLPDTASDETSLGTLIHAILERFYSRWRAADADGLTPPGLPELLALGRRMWSGALKRHQVAKPEELDQLEAQLRLLFSHLHDPRANIVEIERSVRVVYPLGPHEHTLVCKIDRIDDLGDGRYRLIDYKTGQAWGKYTKPTKKDLQMGLYALALGQLYGTGVQGVAEYWLLQTGERGAIALEALDLATIKEGINEAIEGMLSGRWERSDDCTSEMCALLDG